jgi:hypothetical protein
VEVGSASRLLEEAQGAAVLLLGVGPRYALSSVTRSLPGRALCQAPRHTPFCHTSLFAALWLPRRPPTTVRERMAAEPLR